MTKEESIEVMKAYRDRLINSASNQLDGDIEAFNMAIKALEREPCCNCIEFKRYAKEMGFEIEQEPQPNYKALKIISETMMDMVNNKPYEEVMGNLKNNMREMGIEVPILEEQEPTTKENLVVEDCISRKALIEYANNLKDGIGITANDIARFPSIQPKTDVLDKIRAEIEQEYNRLSVTRDETLELGECLGLKMSLKIIGKYTAGKEQE